MPITRRLVLALAMAASMAGCAVAQRTDLLRKDVLSAAQKVYVETKLQGGDLAVDASVDRTDTTYDPGQPITLSVKTDKKAYVAILRVLASGDTTIVFPNRQHPDAAVAANTVLTVPGPGDAVKLAAEKPGTVLFEIIASTAGDSWPFHRKPDSGSDFADLGVTTRYIAQDLRDALKVGAARATAATHLTVRISGSMF